MAFDGDSAELESLLRRINAAAGGAPADRDLDPRIASRLDHPSRSLVVYGTLAPGRENHHHLESVAGEWSEVVLEGELGDWVGYPMFRWVTPGARIPGWLLRSEHLPEHHERLDAFETDAYARHFVPYVGPDGLGVASCYVANPERG